MIHLAMSHVLAELNNYLSLRSPGIEDKQAVMGSFYDNKGVMNTAVQEKIVMLLVNVEKDSIYRATEKIRRKPDGIGEVVNPEMKINLYVMFAANLSIYSEALKYLSLIISFFQVKNTFQYAELTDLDDIEGRFIFDLHSLGFEQQNHLWGTLGMKYIPSVMYKVSMISIHDDRVEGEIPPITEIAVNEFR
jgi:hypothetical protein